MSAKLAEDQLQESCDVTLAVSSARCIPFPGDQDQHVSDHPVDRIYSIPGLSQVAGLESDEVAAHKCVLASRLEPRDQQLGVNKLTSCL